MISHVLEKSEANTLLAQRAIYYCNKTKYRPNHLISPIVIKPIRVSLLYSDNHAVEVYLLELFIIQVNSIQNNASTITTKKNLQYFRMKYRNSGSTELTFNHA